MPYKTQEAKNAQNRRWRARNLEHSRAYHNAYYKKYWQTKEHDLRWYFTRLLYNMRHRRDCSITVDNLLELLTLQGWKCALTNRAMTHSRDPNHHLTNISVDRINPHLDYHLGNVRLVCKRVNIMRMDMDDEELIGWCKAVVDHYGGDQNDGARRHSGERS